MFHVKHDRFVTLHLVGSSHDREKLAEVLLAFSLERLELACSHVRSFDGRSRIAMRLVPGGENLELVNEKVKALTLKLKMKIEYREIPLATIINYWVKNYECPHSEEIAIHQAFVDLTQNTVVLKLYLQEKKSETT